MAIYIYIYIYTYVYVYIYIYIRARARACNKKHVRDHVRLRSRAQFCGADFAYVFDKCLPAGFDSTLIHLM